MKRLKKWIVLGLSLILVMQNVFYVNAEESQNIETENQSEISELTLNVGDKVKVDVPYYEDSYNIVNGVEPVIYYSSDKNVANLSRTGITIGGNQSSLHLEIRAVGEGNCNINIYMRETGQILAEYNVTVNPMTAKPIDLCVDEKTTFTLEYNTKTFSFDFGNDDVNYEVHKNSTSQTSFNGNYVSKTEIEMSFDTIGQYKIYFYDENDYLINQAALNVSDHTMSENGTITKEPTCTEDGVMTYVCTKCGFEKNESIPALDHTLTLIDEKAPTCTEDGIKQHYHCESCNKNFIDEECNNEISDEELLIPATGHAYGDWIIDKEPTESSEGHKYKECANCGEKIEESIPVINSHKNEWYSENGNWYYRDENGEYVSSSFKVISGNTYYFNEDGTMKTGWAQLNGSWYFFRSSGTMQIGWAKISGTWYYFKTSGSMVTGWAYIDGSWYFFKNSGAMATGWTQLSGTWYYFKGSGAMQTGWAKISETWYYFRNSGAMQTGWAKISETWYYFRGSGAMQTGWAKLDGYWYYFSESGAMQTGWQYIDDTWYYFDNNGCMK